MQQSLQGVPRSRHTAYLIDDQWELGHWLEWVQ